MNTVVIYESMTGNTREAANRIGAGLEAAGHTIGAVSPTREVNLQALSAADLVIVGTWTDGLFVVGQRPAHGGRLASLPFMVGKLAAVFCTYGLDAGKTIPKLTRIVEGRGGTVVHGAVLNRRHLPDDSAKYVVDLLGALAQAPSLK